MKGDKIQTGLRMPEPMYLKIQEYADTVGVSLNSAILILVDIGYNVAHNINPPKP